jgi:hypothetical protein
VDHGALGADFDVQLPDSPPGALHDPLLNELPELSPTSLTRNFHKHPPSRAPKRR